MIAVLRAIKSFAPLTTELLKVTVGLAVSITTPARAADAVEVPPLYVCFAVNE